MAGPAISIDSLALAFGSKRVLRGVSLGCASGECLGLIGPNGAGKTTLVGCLLGLLRPDAGRVSIDGRPPSDPRVRRGLGHVPERCGFDRGSDALAVLRLHHALAGLPREHREADIRAALDRCGLERAGDRPVRRLSKGMRQRLAFASALLGEPSWLVLDEPFSGLDPAGVADLRALVRRAHARGATILLNSHRLDQVGRLCDRVVLLAEGRIASIEQGGPGAETELERRVVAAARGAAP